MDLPTVPQKTKYTLEAVLQCGNGEIEIIGDMKKDWDDKPFRRLCFTFRQWARRVLGVNFGYGNNKRSHS